MGLLLHIPRKICIKKSDIRRRCTIAVFSPAGIPPLTAAEQDNKARYLAVFQGHSPEAHLSERLDAIAQVFLFDLMELPIAPPMVSLDPTSNGDSRAQTIVAYARSRPQTVTVQELAEVFGYSTRQVTRLFHQATGQSCIRFIQSCREEQFLALLVGSDISISRALELSGIRSVSQYFTAFRARYGMSPAEYRQTYRRR